MRMPVLTLASLALAAAAPAQAALTVRTAIAVPSPRAGWLVCDSVDSGWAALVGRLSASRVSAITLVAKATGAAATASYKVGPPDPGAGQIFYSLTRNGADAGNLHAVNPGLIDPSLPEPLNFTSISIDGHELGCRLVDNIRLMAVTARRGVTVTRANGHLVYRSFNFANPGAVVNPDGVQKTNVPSLQINNGTVSYAAGGAATFRFVNGSYLYRIALPAGTAVGRLTVVRGGRTILSERLLGFTLVRG